jgi:hypothetical protein
MNTKMKTVSIALTGGILLGWGASATLAENVVGVSYFGEDQAEITIDADKAADIISWDPDTGLVTLQYGQANGLNMQSGENGKMIAVTIDAAGTGYLQSEEATQTVVNTDLTGLDAQWSYSVDGVIGEAVPGNIISIDKNDAGNSLLGTGYVDALFTASDATEIVSVWQFDQACAGTTFGVGATGGIGAALPGILTVGTGLDDGNCDYGTADEAGDICNIIIDNGGIGYGDTLTGATAGEMMIYNRGVLSEDYTATFDTDGNGVIVSIDMVLNGAPVDLELLPTNWDQLTLVPNANGVGFDYSVELYGEIANIANPSNGTDCTSLEFAAVPLINGCTTCTTPAPGQGASVSMGSIPVGAVVEAAIVDKGFNYDAAPAISIDDSVFAAPHTGEVAAFTAVMGADSSTLTFSDGIDAEFIGDWVLSFSDFNGDDIMDIVAYDRGEGVVLIATMTFGFTISDVNEAGTVGDNWEIVGTLGNQGDGASIFWRNPDSGANAVWICDTNSATNGGVVKQPESDLIEAASTGWYSNVTNSENNVLWYNPMTGLSATWTMAVDASMPAVDWVADNAFLANGGLIYNIGADNQWILDGVGVLDGADVDSAKNDDLVWVNASNGGVALWIMDGNLISSFNYATIGGMTYNGTDAGVSMGNRIVGVGNYEASTRVSTTTGAFEVTDDALFASLWWNRSGDTYVWSMDRTISLQTWTNDGVTNDGTGLLANPFNVREYTRY